ncbi:MAG TPA: 2OG-Fe(II) oxygenase [Myxococcaceae bacterium]|nr:2OG-Fe(II) oxygenase [Myxococcaceae bacterium]
MPAFVVNRRAFDAPSVERLRESLLASPYVAKSTLGGSFRGSRGFAITFTAQGRAALEERFPFLSGYLAQALDPSAGRRLQPWYRRLIGRTGKEPNAFYLNLLLLGEGGGVGRHVDATLRGPSGVEDAVPERVSVLYLQVPERKAGGELRLYRDHVPVGVFQPEPGALLHFRGELLHEVTPLEGAAEGALRASLVCEQYHLPPPALEQLAPVQVQSKAGFAAYLTEKRLSASFEVER